MVMITCSECGSQVSGKAENCPNCGFNRSMHFWYESGREDGKYGRSNPPDGPKDAAHYHDGSKHG